jgi:hypothetical protein
MTGPLNGAKPSSALCRKAGCKDLVAKKIQTGSMNWKTCYYCGIKDKVPGNMYRCPKEEE